MTYDSFLDTITKRMRQLLGEDTQLTLISLLKNNGAALDGLSILPPGSRLAPTIYLTPYYHQLQQGMALEEVLSDIWNLYLQSQLPSHISSLSAEDLSDFPSLRSRIMFKLIHTASNSQLLSEIPSLPFLDLSIVFYLSLASSKSGQTTALIHSTHARQWKTSAQELWALARENTPQTFPAQFHPMSQVLQEIASERNLPEPDSSPLYVLTNSGCLYGAGCILYPQLLSHISQMLESDLILLPSSIHEFLILPDQGVLSYDELSRMVTEINQTEVLLEDRLSNQVYRYSRSDGQIQIVSNGKNCVGAFPPPHLS